MGAFRRGLRNPFRNVVRTAVAVCLLALVVGLLALMVQAAFLSRQQLGRLEARVRTLIELREAGAFGTGGFGGDKPIGEEDFSVDTIEKVKRIPRARHIVKIEEYIYTPQIDPSKENAYAMIIGMRPGSAMRAIGEIDYENAQLIAGRALREEDDGKPVAVVGKLYAKQRLGLAEPTETALAGREVSLSGKPFRVVGVYTTENDFGDNHVFIPLAAFRETFHPGKKLGKIFVNVDSVAHVEKVVEELKAIPEADVVTTPEAVSTARTTLGGIAATSTFGSIMLFAVGGVLVAFVMVLITKERIREIGTLKAIGASNAEVVGQFLAEVFTLTLMAGAGALPLAYLSRPFLRRTLGLALEVDRGVFLLILVSSLLFGVIGSLYPIMKGLRLSPVEAMGKA
ncbi:MAG: ABC transporter permease [Candidatus Rokubacteria bacterium]|nr:ABC transporter permease [Candidatus Rokubacteria bacterium]